MIAQVPGGDHLDKSNSDVVRATDEIDGPDVIPIRLVQPVGRVGIPRSEPQVTENLLDPDATPTRGHDVTV